MTKGPKLDLSIGIKRLRLETNRLVNSKIVGNYRSVFKGRGLEFLDYRAYSASDDASMIDWKASIKSGDLLIKEFAEERNLNVFFLIDVSSSMIYSSIDKLKIEYAAELASTLSYTVVQAGDSISFAFFNDRIVVHNPPSSGSKQYYKLVKTLVDPRYYGGDYDLAEALRFTMASLKEFSIVILISDFIGLKEGWKHYLKLVGKKFDLIGVMIRDPRDMALPDYDGQAVLTDVFSQRQILVDVSSVKEDYERSVQAQEREIESAFIDSKSDFIKLETDKPFIKPIADLFLRRARKHR